MKVGIVGANGYSGIELIRLLQHHPFAKIEMIMSHSSSGLNIKDLYPHLSQFFELPLETVQPEQLEGRIDLVFFATPSGVSQKLAPSFLEKGITCIDLSGDFRLKDPATYEKWYKKQAAKEEDLAQAVYGLPEFFSNSIKEAKLIANPGCYPTATLLGILPAIQEGIIDQSSLIIDGKSGVSGAGRTPSLGTHYGELNESLKAYKVGEHQHIPEIEQTIQMVSGIESPVSFTTHLVPMTRGILITQYAALNKSVTAEELVEMYRQFYKNAPFVRIREAGHYPSTKEVYGSNYCDISFFVDERTRRLTVVSVIDNLVKGASGQAIQNMNLMNGWDETAGLAMTPVYP